MDGWVDRCVYIYLYSPGKVAQQVVVFAAKSANMSLIFRTYRNGGETQFPKVVL